jgi:TetR/AcrR family transcriptional regulator
MPTTTFLNLPEEKRRRIFDAAVLEFSRFAFAEASINRVVKEAAIPRGSFYQYFSDKEDLYLYMMERIAEEKFEVFFENAPHPDADFFETASVAVPDILRWGESHPDYYRIAMLAARDPSQTVAKIALRMNDSHRAMTAILERDQKRGRIRADVDCSLATDLLFSISLSLLDRLGKGEDIPTITGWLQKLYHMVRFGIAQNGGEGQ